MMVKRIYKYKSTSTAEEQKLQLPFDARILDVQIQNGRLCLWAIVDPSKDNLMRTFRVFGTGWDLPYRFVNRYVHLKTVQDGGFVWHVFEVIGE